MPRAFRHLKEITIEIDYEDDGTSAQDHITEVEAEMAAYYEKVKAIDPSYNVPTVHIVL